MNAIKKLHTPINHYHFSHDCYQPTESFKVRVGQPHVMYVMTGKCKITAGDDELLVQSGEFTSLPIGDYRFHIIGNGEVKLVRAYKLPATFIKNKL